MAYKRKTRDYYSIQQFTAQGWEEVNAEDTREDAKRSLREYRENQPEFPARFKVRREKITCGDCLQTFDICECRKGLQAL